MREDSRLEPHFEVLTGQLIDVEIRQPWPAELLDRDLSALWIDVVARSKIDLLPGQPSPGLPKLAIGEALGDLVAVRVNQSCTIAFPDSVPAGWNTNTLLRI